MKILQIVGNSAFGGATYLILEWCKFLAAHGCTVDVLSTDPVTIQSLESIPGVKIIRDILIPREIKLLSDMRAFVKLWKLIKREKYDVVHTYTATPGVLGRLVAGLSGVPAIFHHQAAWTVGESSSVFHRLIYTPLEYLAAGMSTRVICVSHAVMDHGKKYHLAPQEKLITVPNGINPAPFLGRSERVSLCDELGIDPNKVIIGTTGRLAPDKDFPTLFQAARELMDLLSGQFIFILVGDGPDRCMLETMSRDLDLQEFVRFLGFRKDIPRLLAGMDIFVTTSLREGLSISILEAMAAARPIIATSIPPNAELIEHEVTGLLVPPGSPQQVSLAIARFIQDDAFAKKCARAARQKVIADYSIERMFSETWELYCHPFSTVGTGQA